MVAGRAPAADKQIEFIKYSSGDLDIRTGNPDGWPDSEFPIRLAFAFGSG